MYYNLVIAIMSLCIFPNQKAKHIYKMYGISSIFKINDQIIAKSWDIFLLSMFTLFIWTKAKIQISMKQNAQENKKKIMLI